jgi:hypothetical protein
MCPWIDWQPASLKFCEAMLCGYIRQPANSLSNIAFIITGILILLREKGSKGFSPYHLMGLSSISIGITSGIYHASMTFFWQFFDVSSMFMLILLALTFNLTRIGWLKWSQFVGAYFLMLVTSMGLMLFIQGKSGEWIFAVEVAITVLVEFFIYRQKLQANFKPFFQAIGIFLLSFVIWTGDIQGWWCDPDNHFLQGHAAWHVLNAFTIWYLYKFYQQFEKKI